MPIYKSKKQPYVNKYGMDFNTNTETITYVIIPTPDPDIDEINSSPVWLPVLDSNVVSLATGATSDIQVPFFTVPAIFRVKVTSGNLNIYFNDFTSTPLRLTNRDIFEMFWDKHFVWNLRFEGGSGGCSFVYNIYENRPRDGQSWR